MSNNTKILIYENEELIKRIDQAYLNEKTQILNLANNVIALFGEFDEGYAENGSTTESYLQLLENGPQHYIEAAVERITDQFASTGITAPEIIGTPIALVYQKGNGLTAAYNELLRYLEIVRNPRTGLYPELKFELNEIEVVNGLAAVKAEKDLEPLKDRLARSFIDTEDGYTLIDKAKTLVNALNSINTFLRSKNIYNITELNEFGDLVKYKHHIAGSDDEVELNLPGIFNYANKFKNA